MTIVLVGDAFTGKAKVAKAITEETQGRFERVKFHTDAPDLPKSKYIYESFVDLDATDIAWKYVYRSRNFFVTKQQFTRSDAIVCVDDPNILRHLDSLGVPLTVVCVNSPLSVMVKRALKAEAEAVEMLDRFYDIAPRSHTFVENQNYSFYIDTSKVKGKCLKHAVHLFVDKLVEWEREMNPSSRKMLTLVEKYGTTRSKESGFLLV